MFWLCCSVSCVCCIPCREIGRLTVQPPCEGYTTMCCSITGTYDNVFTVLTYNFSKKQYVLPEDDLRIETCSSVLMFWCKDFRLLQYNIALVGV